MVFHLHRDPDIPLASLGNDSVDNSIFHKRLQRNFYHFIWVGLFLNIEMIFYFSLITFFLNLNISAYMCDLLSDGVYPFPGVKPRPVELRKGFYNMTCFFIVALKCDPVDHIQCIIEKMRIDLFLQYAQFCIFLLGLHADLLVYQFSGPVYHLIKSLGKII